MAREGAAYARLRDVAGVASGGPTGVSIPGYSELRRIGVGGSATVYRAWQDGFAREVALKVLSFDLVGAKARDRFARECAAAGSLSAHPNIVTVFDAGVSPSGQPYIAMELLERGSLADVLRVSGPLPADEVLRLGVKLCGALATAHQAGILHRDLKAENVLISAFDEPALTDFGISTVAEAATAVMTSQSMTPVHAPPEVIEANRATAASDIYSLGSTLYQALTGRAPFASVGDETLLTLMLRVLRDPVPPIHRGDLPPGLESLLDSCMAKQPADRPASAAEVGARLQDLQLALGLPRTELQIGGPGGSAASKATAGVVTGDATVSRAAVRGAAIRPLEPADPPNARSMTSPLAGPGAAVQASGGMTRIVSGRSRAALGRAGDAATTDQTAARRLPMWAIIVFVTISALLAGFAMLTLLVPGHKPTPPPPTTVAVIGPPVSPGQTGPVTTTGTVDPNAPSAVKVVAVTATDLEVSWTAPTTFTPAGYIVFLTPGDGTAKHPCGTPDTTGSSCFPTGAAPSLTIPGLDAAHRTYCASVIAFGKTAATAKGFTSPRACTKAP